MIKKFDDLNDFCMRVGFNRVNKRILTALIGSGAMDTFGDRKDVFNQIDTALKNAEQALERNKSNIKDLFGDEVILTANDVPDSKIEFDRALNEWNALGFYLNSHPLEEKKKRLGICVVFLYLSFSRKLTDRE